MSSAKRKFVIFLPPMLTVPSWSCSASVGHNSLQENVEEGGGNHTASSYSDCGSESVPYAVVKVDCAGGLVIEVLYHSDQVDLDVVFIIMS